jgi:putative ABC transport system permease protein
VKIKIGAEEKEYIITAIFQSMTNMGEGIRFSEKEDLDYSYVISNLAIQVFFNKDLTSNQKEEYFNKVRQLFTKFDVYTGGEYIGEFMGGISSQLNDVKQFIVIVIIAINMLVSILMVKTFITKEKGEIGMLKSIGFSNDSIISWQVLRIGIILIISTIIGAIISNPISQISSGQVFTMMGASHIEFVIKPLEVYLMYPAIILVCTLFTSFLSALQIKRISAQETNNIE